MYQRTFVDFYDPSYHRAQRSKSPQINRHTHFQQFEIEHYIDHHSKQYDEKSSDFDDRLTNGNSNYGFQNQRYQKHKNYGFRQEHREERQNYGFRQEQQNYNQHHAAPLSPQDQYRKKIAEENRKIVRKHPDFIDFDGVKTIGIDHHFNIPTDVNRNCPIRVFDCSTIEAAIECHSAHPHNKICLLNFANSVKPGGGYLNGRNAQEECLCRQTLLYPTLQKSYMYNENKRRGSRPEASDIMIYSPNVLVIRNDDYKMIHPFKVDIISSAAVDNRSGNIYNIEEIMLNRIRKIIKVAAEENVEILILGAFGCGVFKNDPKTTAKMFYHVLVKEGFKKYFRLVLFPIYKSQYLYNVFSSTFDNKNRNEEQDENEEKHEIEIEGNDNDDKDDQS